MRNVARLKMGYYPLPEPEGVKLRSLLSFAGLAARKRRFEQRLASPSTRARRFRE